MKRIGRLQRKMKLDNRKVLLFIDTGTAYVRTAKKKKKGVTAISHCFINIEKFCCECTTTGAFSTLSHSEDTVEYKSNKKQSLTTDF